jgi:hypothetical protein
MGIVVADVPVPSTTLSVPETKVVLPGKFTKSWETGIVAIDDTMTFVTPPITVVLPDSGAAEFTGIVVSPETTISDAPGIIVEGPPMGVAPIPEAMALAIAAAEDDAGDKVCGEVGRGEASGLLAFVGVDWDAGLFGAGEFTRVGVSVEVEGTGLILKLEIGVSIFVDGATD